METPKTLTLDIYILIFLLIFFRQSAVGDYKGDEREALYAIKHSFNHPLLNRNWNGLQCYLNDPRTTWYGITCINGRVTGISLPDLGLSGQLSPNVLFNLTQLTLLNFRNNSISGNLMDFSANGNLTRVDLSENMLGGPISPSLLGLNSLILLELHDNFLTDAIPAFNQSSLRELSVANNDLSGKIPDTHVLQSFDVSSYMGNPSLCGPPSQTVCPGDPAGPPIEKDKKSKKILSGSTLVAIFVVVGVIALAIIIFLLYVYYKKTKPTKGDELASPVEKKKYKNEVGNGEKKIVAEEEQRGKLTFMVNQGGFELGDLLKASAEGLGKGNFGACYKAMLDDGSAFVVKRLRDLNPLSGEEFEKHMRLLDDLKHRNLLPLVAYYHSKDEKLLVYEFVQNGSLFSRIHARRRGNDRVPFKWNSRLSVVQGITRAMAYLHVNAKTSITHGNLKSSNVLLGDDDTALVSDYGFSSLISISAIQRMVSYKTPECQNRRKVSRKSDVWSYGSLLLEIITGRIPIHSAPQGSDGVDLCNWVHRAVREEWTAEIFDLEIAVQKGASDGLLKLLQIALRCCEKSPEKRPEMIDVLREVEDIKIKEADDNSNDSYDRSYTDDSTSTNG
ncbi:putative inactive receptor kinase At4g23740 [Tasmannia lanceolata]|uniref:putative inactive receptor kinase At4g23740 n=1 Tax=Tasmannia lanceolata TaxID=3420 RepID=UPI004063BD7B